MKQNKLRTLYEKDMTKKILASLLSILIGLEMCIRDRLCTV